MRFKRVFLVNIDEFFLAWLKADFSCWQKFYFFVFFACFFRVFLKFLLFFWNFYCFFEIFIEFFLFFIFLLCLKKFLFMQDVKKFSAKAPHSSFAGCGPCKCGFWARF